MTATARTHDENHI